MPGKTWFVLEGLTLVVPPDLLPWIQNKKFISALTMNTPASNSSSKNVLNSDVELKGTLKFSGELTFDGKLEGDIHTDGALTLGDNAVIKGAVNVNSVVL